MASRRDFISAAAITIGAAGAMGIEANAQQLAVGFDAKEFNALLHAPYRHKQVFATARAAKGAVFAYMMNSLNAYQFGFNEGAATLHAAAVLYGTGVTLGFDDYAWREYGLGALAAADDENEYLKNPHGPTLAADRNPYIRATSSLNAGDHPDDDKGFYHDHSIEALRKRGASFLVCNNAATRVASVVAKVRGGDAAAIKHDLLAHLAPGALLVPAGVAAVNAAQEAKFSLFQATTV